MKKISLILLVVFLPFCLVLANNFDQEYISWTEEKLLEQLSGTYNDLDTEYNNELDELKQHEYFYILYDQWKLDFLEAEDEMLDEYFDLEDDIIDDFSWLRSEFRDITRQKNHNRITAEEFEDLWGDIYDQMQYYNDKFEQDISDYKDEFESKIQDLGQDFEETKQENEDKLQKIINKIESIEQFFDEKYELTESVDKINEIYVWSSATIHEFIENFEDRTIDALSWSLNSAINTKYNRYPNLKNLSDESILQRKQSLLSNYKSNLEEYFYDIIEWFYDKSVYNWIVEKYEDLQQDYMTNWQFCYNSLLEFELSKLEDFKSQIKEQKQSINEKMKEFDDAETYEEIRQNLLSRAENFYDTEKQDKVEQLESKMDREVEYLTLKSSRQLESYNSIMSQIDDIQDWNYSAEQKISKIQNVRSNIDSLVQDIVDGDLKTDLENKRWELYLEKIDSQIRNRWLIRFNAQYPNINELLLNILNDMHDQAWDRWQTFKDRVGDAIKRADTLIEKWWISQRNEYLLLRIKQSMIEFLYL